MNHRYSIESRNETRFIAIRRYRAKCTKDKCGWAGEWRRLREEADGDGLAHQAVVAPQEDEAA